MARKLGWFLVFIGYIALVSYFAMGDTGPIGWLDSFQQENFGSYSRKTSAVVLTFIVTALISPLLLRLMRADARARIGDEAARDPAKLAAAMQLPGDDVRLRDIGWRKWLISWVALMLLIWLACLGWGAWDAFRRGGDTRATYAPIEVSRTAAPPAGADHLALTGRLLWERVVSKKQPYQTLPEEELVPIVGRDWREGDPVQFVARVELGDRTIERRPRPFGRDPILVRLGGAPPTAAGPVFAKMGVPLADGAVAVTVVPSKEGRPLESSGVDWDTVKLWGIALSVLCSVLVPLFAFVIRKNERIEAEKKSRAASGGGAPPAQPAAPGRR